MPQTALASISDGDARLVNVFSGQSTTAPFDFIVTGVHPKPNNELQKSLPRDIAVVVIDDALAPRSALEAFREGDRIGRTI